MTEEKTVITIGGKAPKPRPPLPCNEPNKMVFLWVRQDPDREVLTHSCLRETSLKSHCGVSNPIDSPKRWRFILGEASEVTCSLCMKAEGLYPGWPPHKHRKLKRRGVRPRPRTRAEQEIEDLKAWLDTGHAGGS